MKRSVQPDENLNANNGMMCLSSAISLMKRTHLAHIYISNVVPTQHTRMAIDVRSQDAALAPDLINNQTHSHVRMNRKFIFLFLFCEK